MVNPKWRRRADARPGEIVAAALHLFASKGFAATRLEEIAQRAGISKGTLYLYFETKEEMFRAVIREAASVHVETLGSLASRAECPFSDAVRAFLRGFADIATRLPVGAVAKMVIGESRNFPELAKVWHDEVAGKAVAGLAGLVERAQRRGEVRPGDARIQAFSLIGPLLIGLLWSETLTPIGAAPIDLCLLAEQHADTALSGLLGRD